MDAAAWVEQSIGSMPKPFEVTVRVVAPAESVREALRWTDSTVEAIDGSACRVVTRAETMDWVVSTVAQIAVQFDIEVEGPAEVVAHVAGLTARLVAAAPDGG